MVDEISKEARARVQQLKGFYINIASYLVINAMLVIINLIVTPGTLWFYWVTIFWGAALVLHALTIFVFSGRMLGSEWEERKAREIMEKEERRKAG